MWVIPTKLNVSIMSQLYSREQTQQRTLLCAAWGQDQTLGNRRPFDSSLQVGIFSEINNLCSRRSDQQKGACHGEGVHA